MTSLVPGPATLDDDPAATREDVLAGIAGAAALAAGVIHLAVTPHHLVEAPVLGALFLLVGLGQVALALSFQLALGVRTLVLVVVAHVGVIAVYVTSRTVELPFMPPHDAGHDVRHLPVAGGVGNGVPIYPGSRIEQLGVLDLGCLAAELVLVLAVLALLPERWRARFSTALALLAGLAVALRAATWLA